MKPYESKHFPSIVSDVLSETSGYMCALDEGQNENSIVISTVDIPRDLGCVISHHLNTQSLSEIIII